jgi:cell division protein FtsB
MFLELILAILFLVLLIFTLWNLGVALEGVAENSARIKALEDQILYDRAFTERVRDEAAQLEQELTDLKNLLQIRRPSIYSHDEGEFSYEQTTSTTL